MRETRVLQGRQSLQKIRQSVRGSSSRNSSQFVPGEIVRVEYEIGMEGSVTYEFDILTTLGREYKVDIDVAFMA